MATLGKLSVILEAQTSKFAAGLAKLQGDLESFSTKAASIATKAGLAFTGAGAGIGVALKAASDLEENVNVLNVSFGQQSEAVVRWAQTVGRSMGRSELQMRQFAGGLQSMLSPMIGNQKAAATMSLNLSQLAVDLGSFFNIADNDVLRALRSGIAGEAEPLKRFGIVMSEAALQSFAFSKGIDTSVQKMGIAQKTALRYQFIMEKTAQAHGDAARTADSFANQTKALEASMQDLRARVGEVFIEGATEQLSLATRAARLAGDAMRTASPEAKEMARQVVQVGTVALGSVAGIAGLTAAMTALQAGFIGALRAAIPMAVVVGKMALIAAGVAISVATLKRAWERNFLGIQDFTFAVFDAIGKGARELLKGLRESLGAISQFAIFGAHKLGVIDEQDALAIIELMDRESADLFDRPLENLKAGVKEIGGDFEGIAKGLGKLLKGAVGGASEQLEDLLDALQDQIGAPIEVDKGVGTLVSGTLEMPQQATAPQESKIKSISDLARAIAMEHAPKLESAAGVMADAFTQSAPRLSSAINTGLEAFSRGGGPQEAIAAMAAQLLSSTQAFANLSGMIDGVLTDVLGVLDMMLAPFIDLIKVVMPLTQVAARLALAFNPMFLAISALGGVISSVTDLIGSVVDSIVGAFNWLIRKLAGILDKIGLGGKLRKLLISTGNVDAVGEGVAAAVGMFDAISDEVERSGGLTNAPAGFKIALDRFNAILGESIGPATSPVTPAGAMAGGAGAGGMTVIINGMEINTDNLPDLMSSIERETAWDERMQVPASSGPNGRWMGRQEGRD